MTNRLINYGLVLFAFVLPISTPLSNATVALLILLWIIEGKWKEKWNTLWHTKAFLFFTAFILLLGLSLLWSESWSGGFGNKYSHNMPFAYLRGYLFDFMVFPIILTSLKRSYIPYVISAFLAAMFISELFSWGIFMEWIHYKHIHHTDPSPFMHHSFYSIFLAVTVFVLLSQFQRTTSRYYKTFILLFALSALVNLFLNGGRLGQLAFFIALFVYIATYYHISLKSIALTIVASLLLFITAYKASPIFHKRMDTSLHSLQKIYKGDYHSSWGIRTNILIVSKELVKENPLFGIGIGNTRTALLEKAKSFPQTGFFPKLRHLHNGYIQILVEVGIVGLVLFLGFIYQMFRLSLPKYTYALMATIIAIYLVGFIGEPLLFSRKPFLLFLLFIGIFLLSAREHKKTQISS